MSNFVEGNFNLRNKKGEKKNLKYWRWFNILKKKIGFFDLYCEKMVYIIFLFFKLVRFF